MGGVRAAGAVVLSALQVAFSRRSGSRMESSFKRRSSIALVVGISAIVSFSGGLLMGFTSGKNSAGNERPGQESLRSDGKSAVLARFQFPSGDGAPLAADVTITLRGSDIVFEASLVPDRDVWVGTTAASACNELGNAAVITTFPDLAHARFDSYSESAASRPRKKGVPFRIRITLKGMQIGPVDEFDSLSRSISVFLHVTERIPGEFDLHFDAQRFILQFTMPRPN